ncbi:MAG: hypothetical protein A2287_02180 [Candidatus Melainabacteria bacterium RIFOXYA12_FULL_32_12]|nr:MAG: hypothetical protein A2104_05690 [Candidatus Melainabacteria bacterium GWF2_32_7]OGI31048.1 MAG: hypothetical protein A2287_02180 [Candidatus Melainabacteria bacterium RIFOXYA12_FULL_32_12]
MSFVSLLGWQLRNIDTRYNGQAAAMNARQGMMNMLQNPHKYSPEQTLQMEKQLMFRGLIGQTMAKAAEAQEDGTQKMLNKAIERSFNYLA